MLQVATLVLFPSLMVYAAVSDLFTMTISNRISIALVVLFLPLAAFAGLSGEAIAIHLACGAGVLVMTFAMFAFGWIGGGDAKLAAATAIWMGAEHLADYGVYASIIGGIMTLAILGVRHLPLPFFALRIDWMVRLHDRATGVPYGIALAAAGLMLYPETGLWHAASIV